MTVLRRLTADDWPAWRELRLAALTEAPEFFGATLADWQGAGDTERRWRDRLTDVPLNIVAESDGRGVGMVSGVPDGAAVELFSLWVTPAARGTGVADALVGAAVAWAGRCPVRLRVARHNRRAETVYLRQGFTRHASTQPGRQCGDTEHVMVRPA